MRGRKSKTAARNLQPHYNIAPTARRCETSYQRNRVGLDALGTHSMVVEKAPQAITGQLQRESGERCRQSPWNAPYDPARARSVAIHERAKNHVGRAGVMTRRQA